MISHSVGVDRRFLFYIRGDSRTAGRRVSHAGRPGVFLFAHGLHKQTLETLTRSRPSRAAAVPGGAAIRQARACDRCPPRLPSRGFPGLAMVPLESHRGEPGRAQQLPRPRDREAHRARPRLAAASIPPSICPAAVLREAPEWGPLSDGGKIAGGGNARPPGAHTRENLESRGAGANDAGAQRHAASEALPGAVQLGGIGNHRRCPESSHHPPFLTGRGVRALRLAEPQRKDYPYGARGHDPAGHAACRHVQRNI